MLGQVLIHSLYTVIDVFPVPGTCFMTACDDAIKLSRVMGEEVRLFFNAGLFTVFPTTKFRELDDLRSLVSGLGLTQTGRFVTIKRCSWMYTGWFWAYQNDFLSLSSNEFKRNMHRNSDGTWELF